MTAYTAACIRLMLRSLAHDLGQVAALVLTVAFMIAAFAMT
jgi:hypothetical protein